ncbi:sulfatase-like hydrolase/transferase [Bermanella marisrubri]|uniref:sulfatase-like hydrolase/transferase n=1 Tax=Bermanella marisrubri TaxID=207949 RepID=UPI001403FFD3|nr:sulfatase-like hydrolase/transferase [Bermanella marisrubri]QIZ85080.1 sulfatase-like hydrolase/transferase [Bermanella marisrubri]
MASILKHYKVACVVAALAIFSFISNPVTSDYNKKNVLIIGIDSLRPELIHEYMPFLSKQLSDAMVFDNAYTPFARTYPAWMSIITGRHPANNGARFNLQPEDMLAKDNLYLPKVLQEHGYTTIYAADERRFSNLGSTQGFQHVIGPRTGVSDFVLGDYADFPTTNLLLLTPVGKWLLPELYGNRAADHLYRPEHFSNLLTNELDHVIHDDPILLATHFCLPHWPYTFVNSHPVETYEQQPLYPSNLQAVDNQIQDLMLYLEERGILKNSILVFLSDHGESWGHFETTFKDKHGIPYESSDYGHGMNILSPASHQILLAFKGIAIDPQQMIRPTSLTDVAPSLLSGLNLSSSYDSQKMDGRDLTAPANQSSELAFESGVILSAANTDSPDPRAVAREGAHRFKVDGNGYLRLKHTMIPSMIQNKQVGLRVDNKGLFLVHHNQKPQLMHIDYANNHYQWINPRETHHVEETLTTRFCALYHNTAAVGMPQLCQ